MSEMSGEHNVFFELWTRRRQLNASRFGLMGSVLSTASTSTTPSRSPPRVRFSHGAQEERLGGSFGSEQICGRRSTGSQEQGASVALLRESSADESQGQQMGDVGTLSAMLPEAQLHASNWCASYRLGQSQSGKCQESLGRVNGSTGREGSSKSRVGEGDDGQGDRRRKDEGASQRLQGAAQEGVDQSGKGEQGTGEALDWAAEFRVRGLRREGTPVDPKIPDELGASESTGKSFSSFSPRRSAWRFRIASSSARQRWKECDRWVLRRPRKT